MACRSRKDCGTPKLTGASRLTMEGALVGTVSYMAPEQVLRRDVDQRSDLWAFVFITFGVRNAMMATDTHFPRLETGSLSPVLPNRVTCFAVQTGGPAAS